jgi:hypothetical protein
MNEARFRLSARRSVTLWEAQNLSTTYTRGGAVPFHDRTIARVDLWSHQLQFSDTMSWSLGKHYSAFRRQHWSSHVGWYRQ